jgi:hypothetical protein
MPNVTESFLHHEVVWAVRESTFCRQNSLQSREGEEHVLRVWVVLSVVAQRQCANQAQTTFVARCGLKQGGTAGDIFALSSLKLFWGRGRFLLARLTPKVLYLSPKLDTQTGNTSNHE